MTLTFPRSLPVLLSIYIFHLSTVGYYILISKKQQQTTNMEKKSITLTLSITIASAVLVPLIFLMIIPSTRAAFTKSAKGSFPFRGRSSLFTSAIMKELPQDVVQYSQVPKPGSFFTATTIPKGLLRDHTTRVGTWGVIRVSSGTLEYSIPQEEPSPVVVVECSPDLPGIIEPQVKHHVKALSEDLKFVVEFYRLPGTGPVDEQREGL
jgi:tellurite resistance-related uncharacterized protein